MARRGEQRKHRELSHEMNTGKIEKDEGNRGSTRKRRKRRTRSVWEGISGDIEKRMTAGREEDYGIDRKKEEKEEEPYYVMGKRGGQKFTNLKGKFTQ